MPSTHFYAWPNMWGVPVTYLACDPIFQYSNLGFSFRFGIIHHNIGTGLIHLVVSFLSIMELCNICGSTFNGKKSLRSHKLTHDEVEVKCDKCDKVLRNKISLSDHHSENIFQCETCHKSFSAKKTLNRHSFLFYLSLWHISYFVIRI